LRANRKLSLGSFCFTDVWHRNLSISCFPNARGKLSAVSDGVVKRAEIPFPALKEQNRIAELLEQADGCGGSESSQTN